MVQILANEVLKVHNQILLCKFSGWSNVIVQKHTRPQRIVRFGHLIRGNGWRWHIKHQLSTNESFEIDWFNNRFVRRDVLVFLLGKIVVERETVSGKSLKAIW